MWVEIWKQNLTMKYFFQNWNFVFFFSTCINCNVTITIITWNKRGFNTSLNKSFSWYLKYHNYRKNIVSVIWISRKHVISLRSCHRKYLPRSRKMVFNLFSFVMVFSLAFETNADVDNSSSLREDRFREQIRLWFRLHNFSIFFFLFFGFWTPVDFKTCYSFSAVDSFKNSVFSIGFLIVDIDVIFLHFIFIDVFETISLNETFIMFSLSLDFIIILQQMFILHPNNIVQRS